MPSTGVPGSPFCRLLWLRARLQTAPFQKTVFQGIALERTAFEEIDFQGIALEGSALLPDGEKEDLLPEALLSLLSVYTLALALALGDPSLFSL